MAQDDVKSIDQLHRFNQREVMIRQTRGSHQSGKTTTTADVGKC